MVTLLDVIEFNANYCSDVSVTVNTVLGTVCIRDMSGVYDDIFLQGDDAVVFIEEAKQLWDTLETVAMSTCYLHLAKPYIECIWN